MKVGDGDGGKSNSSFVFSNLLFQALNIDVY